MTSAFSWESPLPSERLGDPKGRAAGAAVSSRTLPPARRLIRDRHGVAPDRCQHASVMVGQVRRNACQGFRQAPLLVDRGGGGAVAPRGLSASQPGARPWLVEDGVRSTTSTKAAGSWKATNGPSAAASRHWSQPRPAWVPVGARHGAVIERGSGKRCPPKPASMVRRWSKSPLLIRFVVLEEPSDGDAGAPFRGMLR